MHEMMPSGDDTTTLTSREQRVCIPVGKTQVEGALTTPRGAAGLVLFENSAIADDVVRRAFAQVFGRYRLATFLPDGMPDPESFNAVKDWAGHAPGTLGLRLGAFSCGACTLAAPGAIACHAGVQTAVICGGTMSEAEMFAGTSTPVLLIAGGRDPEGLQASQRALEKLSPASKLHVVTSASRTFREPGVVEEAAQLAALWFLHWLE